MPHPSCLNCRIASKDVVAMFWVQENLDNEYLEATVEQLEVKPILDELRKIAANYDPNVIL